MSHLKDLYQAELEAIYTEAEAQAEIDSDPGFYEDCFICPLSDIGHKAIYTGENTA